MKKVAILVLMSLFGSASFAAKSLPKNMYGESLVCTYGGLTFSGAQDVDALVAQVNETVQGVKASVYLNAGPNSEDSLNVFLVDGDVRVDVGMKVSTITDKCQASASLGLKINGQEKTLQCKIHHSRLAMAEKWTNCDKF